MASIWEIDKVINEIALWPIKRFYPTLVAKRTGLPLERVFARLVELSKDQKICLKWEVRCPGDGCTRTLMVLDEKVVSLKDILCESCGNLLCEDDDFDVYDYVYPVFEINKEYREYLKQECSTSKKKQLLKKSQKLLN